MDLCQLNQLGKANCHHLLAPVAEGFTRSTRYFFPVHTLSYDEGSWAITEAHSYENEKIKPSLEVRHTQI